MVEKLKGNFVSLSIQQFSSHVVEEVFKCASEEKVRGIVNEIVEDPNVLALYQNQYGNYVIQNVLVATLKSPIIEAQKSTRNGFAQDIIKVQIFEQVSNHGPVVTI
ncbi:hypothetical protein Syun_004605 [Stephania yunnanensis]|uniref:PUM-HD domain-containing protein n=1 Tax=Stephania yunnanensis TaxID=152371 RepID=A0AAP0Q1E4_9MAGN